MNFFHQNIDTITGIFLLLISLFTFAFPPRFGNKFYGITTQWTIKNEAAWYAGQKIFAISGLLTGLIFIVIGMLNLRKGIPAFTMVFLLIALWNLSKFSADSILKKRFAAA